MEPAKERIDPESMGILSDLRSSSLVGGSWQSLVLQAGCDFMQPVYHALARSRLWRQPVDSPSSSIWPRKPFRHQQMWKFCLPIEALVPRICRGERIKYSNVAYPCSLADLKRIRVKWTWLYWTSRGLQLSLLSWSSVLQPLKHNLDASDSFRKFSAKRGL